MEQVLLLVVKTKSIYEKRSSSDGTRVLVSRYYPRGVKKSHFDLWIRAASPEVDLLKEYKNGRMDWKEFSKRFRIQTKSVQPTKEALLRLVELLRNGDVTLLCYEKKGQKCHREIVKSILERELRKAWVN